MRLAVIVPARDEHLSLPACLDSLTPFRAAGDIVVVVDNGSRGATGAIAQGRGFETIVEKQAGRGRAVAAGYRTVRERASWVLVVHADMIVAAGTREALTADVAAFPGSVTGALGHRIDDRRLVFRAIEAGNRLRARVLGVPYGDQAQFFSVAAIEASNGFPDLDRYEDLHLALRLRRLGKSIYVDHPVTIPARHWANGVVRATLKNWKVAVSVVIGGTGKLE